MSEDKVFNDPKSGAADFKFGTQVVSVFDDMVGRSVPFYHEIQRMVTELGADFAKPGTNVYDLGCSTGTTLINLNQTIPDNVKFIGIDDSDEMLKKCEGNFKKEKFSRKYELLCSFKGFGLLSSS